MEAFFRKYMWAVHFGLIGLGALFSALLINGVVAVQLAKYTVPEMPRYQADEGGAGSDLARDERDLWVEGLQRRCLFGCPEQLDPMVCPDGCPEGEICEEGKCVPMPEEYQEEELSNVPVLTELNMVLQGVMVAQNPRWSMAMIRDQSHNKTHVSGVGDLISVDPPVEVLEIRRDRVFIDNNGRLEFIRMVDAHDGDPTAGRQQAGRSPSASRARTTAAQRNSGRSGREGGDSGRMVVEQNNNSFTVDRAAVREQLEDTAALTRQARIMPNYRDGEPNGLRLVGVTPNSFYSELGIRSGDVIHSVNGTRITNQRQALELLETMGTERQVTIEVERRGRTQKMEYNIR